MTVVGVVGFVGLGNMGRVLAANAAQRGLPLVAYDAAGHEHVPAGAVAAAGVAEVAAKADVVVFSLPDGSASLQVASEIAASPEKRVGHVLDTSTIGVRAARAVADRLRRAGLGYVDAPVSGGVAGARARSLVVMYSGSDAACEAVAPVVEALSDRRWKVGDRPGMAQALKLANNFLSATALAATTEAVAFGLSAGLDMGTMLEVLDNSSGHSSATADKFPNHVATGRYAAGFANTLMAKDVRLYLEEARASSGRTDIGQLMASVWERFAAEEPGADFTRIFPFLTAPTEPPISST